jgi:hypothetical protein
MGPCFFYNKRMAMSTSSQLPLASPLARFADILCYRFGPDDDPVDPTRKAARSDQPTSPHEELPYKVELWDESRSSVEQVLAVTANGSIGYAAYYAASREYPDRYVTLRHKNNIISRSNPPHH